MILVRKQANNENYEEFISTSPDIQIEFFKKRQGLWSKTMDEFKNTKALHCDTECRKAIT
jgi:hypothetical protein